MITGPVSNSSIPLLDPVSLYFPLNLFPRRLFSFLKRRWNCALVVTRRSPAARRNRSTWPGFLGRFADCIVPFVLWIDKRFLFQAANRSCVLLRSRLFALTRRTRVANDAPEILVREARYLESQISNNLILYRAAKIPKSLDTKKLRNLPSLRSVVFHPTIIAAYYLERFAHLSSQFLSRRGGISAKKGNGLNSWWTY